MNSHPFFSIIVPSYNAAKTIVSAIESIRQQTFQDFEILVIDGASADGTVALVQTAGDGKIKIVSEKDAGIYDAMNKGIQMAKGEWLYFIGSDDELFSNTILNDVHHYISANKCDIVYGNALFKKEGNIYDGEFDLYKLLNDRNICHQAIFYKAEIFKLIGAYNLKYNLLADYDFNVRCFKHPDFVIKYFAITIVIYNNIDGSSAIADPGKEPFFDELPLKRIEQLKEKDGIIKAIQNSFSYKLGNFIVKPFSVIKNILK